MSASGAALAGLAMAMAMAPVRAQTLDPALGPESLIDRPAPEIHVRRVPGGEIVTIADQRGRVVLVELMSRWCSTCRLATTRLSRLQQLHRDSLRIIVVTEDGRDAAIEFAERNPSELTVAWDDGETRRRYGARRLPTFVLIDRSGFVRRVFVGAGEATLAALEETVHRFAR